METETVEVRVSTKMSKLPRNLGFMSTVSIDLHEEIEELIVDESGVTHVTSYQASPPPVSHIILKPSSFAPHRLFCLLRNKLNREVPFCRHLAEKIAFCRFSRANCTLYQTPFLMSVDVKVTREIRFVLPSVTVPSRGVSDDVLRRLVEEQRVESMGEQEKEDTTCSICMEDLSENIIIRLPNCLHLFHNDCISEWLRLQNSCPLCRNVPYEED